MAPAYFVDQRSIVRRIWGNGDTVLLIFAGAAVEFALNKAVDWLYFTGRLPADPLGRLFSTVAYARKIVFAENEVALRAIDTITAIHSGVEAKRGMKIPDWAYRDVLFMLIDYSIRSFELLERRLDEVEKEEVWSVFLRVGIKMGIPAMPADLEQWRHMRQQHLVNDLQRSGFTNDLYLQYRKHLGALRYWILTGVQGLLLPEHVRQLLGLGKRSLFKVLIHTYKMMRTLKLDRPLKNLILPAEYREEIQALDVRVA